MYVVLINKGNKMKKFIGLVFLMICVVLPAKSQLRFGIKGGVNISSVHLNSDLLKADNVTGFQIGPMFETTIPLVGVGIDAAILYSQKGMDVKSDIENTEVKTDYIDIPVNLKWKFGIPLVKAYLAAGPYASFRVGGDKFWEVPESIVGQVKAKSFSAGLKFGAGVELVKHLQVGFNYCLGLSDNYSAEDYNLTTKNRGWSVTAAILF